MVCRCVLSYNGAYIARKKTIGKIFASSHILVFISYKYLNYHDHNK